MSKILDKLELLTVQSQILKKLEFGSWKHLCSLGHSTGRSLWRPPRPHTRTLTRRCALLYFSSVNIWVRTMHCTLHNSQLACRRTQLSKKSASYPTHILHILISWYVQWSSKDTLLLPYRWQGLGNLRRVSRNCLPSLDAQFQSVDIAHRSRSTHIGHWYFWQQSLRMLGRGAAVFCVAWGGHM